MFVCVLASAEFAYMHSRWSPPFRPPFSTAARNIPWEHLALLNRRAGGSITFTATPFTLPDGMAFLEVELGGNDC